MGTNDKCNRCGHQELHDVIISTNNGSVVQVKHGEGQCRRLNCECDGYAPGDYNAFPPPSEAMRQMVRRTLMRAVEQWQHEALHGRPLRLEKDFDQVLKLYDEARSAAIDECVAQNLRLIEMLAGAMKP